MKLIKGILGLIWKIYLFLVVLMTIVLLYPLLYAWMTNEKYFHRGFQLMRFQANVILFLVGIRTKVHGSVPDDKNTSYIICSNHSSYLDVLMLYKIFPNYFIIMGKKELGDVPLFNIYFKKMNILVDRNNAKSAHMSILRACEVMEKGCNLALFPEGTIPPTAPKMRPFKNGAFRVARQLKMPIIPVTFTNNYNLLEDSMKFGANSRPGLATAYIHPPIQINEEEPQDLLTLREQTRAAIQSKLDPEE